MQRIDTLDKLFAAGNPTTGTKGTVVTAGWLNAIQGELAAVVEGLGGTLDPEDAGQVIDELLAFFAPILGSAAQVFRVATAVGASDATPLAQVQSLVSSAARNRNVIINGGFIINQRAYASAALLSAGVYGHDRWKAGAAGGNYSFVQLASNTQITIAAGKSLIQVIEDKNVDSTSYVLSWEGTAQARYAVNSATPAGAYATSPIVITGQTTGTTMSVEFNEGTLGKVQLGAGTSATNFETRDGGSELALCKRYYEAITPYVVPVDNYDANSIIGYFEAFEVLSSKRINPTIALISDPIVVGPGSTGTTISGFYSFGADRQGDQLRLYATKGSHGVTNSTAIFIATGAVTLSCEL